MSDTKQWIEVCDISELAEEDVIGFDHAGKEYALYRLLGYNFYATDGLCTHEQVNLAEGFVFNGCIECPLHNASFNVKTGKAMALPATQNLMTYPAEKRGSKIFVQV